MPRRRRAREGRAGDHPATDARVHDQRSAPGGYLPPVCEVQRRYGAVPRRAGRTAHRRGDGPARHRFRARAPRARWRRRHLGPLPGAPSRSSPGRAQDGPARANALDDRRAPPRHSAPSLGSSGPAVRRAHRHQPQPVLRRRPGVPAPRQPAARHPGTHPRSLGSHRRHVPARAGQDGPTDHRWHGGPGPPRTACRPFRGTPKPDDRSAHRPRTRTRAVHHCRGRRSACRRRAAPGTTPTLVTGSAIPRTPPVTLPRRRGPPAWIRRVKGEGSGRSRHRCCGPHPSPNRAPRSHARGRHHSIAQAWDRHDDRRRLRDGPVQSRAPSARPAGAPGLARRRSPAP